MESKKVTTRAGRVAASNKPVHILLDAEDGDLYDSKTWVMTSDNKAVHPMRDNTTGALSRHIYFHHNQNVDQWRYTVAFKNGNALDYRKSNMEARARGRRPYNLNKAGFIVKTERIKWDEVEFANALRKARETYSAAQVDTTTSQGINLHVEKRDKKAKQRRLPPRHVRMSCAIAASEKIRKFSDRIVAQIKTEHGKGVPYSKLMQDYGITSKGTMSHLINNKYVTVK